MEPNNNNNKRKIIIALCCVIVITLLTIPFLKKDNQIPKTNKKEILNNFDEPKSTNKVSDQSNKKEISNDFETPKAPNQEVSSKKTFFFFIIIGIVVVILIISLIVWLVKRHELLEDFLSKRCYFILNNEVDNELIIGFGDENIDDAPSTILFNRDIYSKQQEFYQNLQNNADLKNALDNFNKMITNFLFQIDGHLLKAYYNQNNNSNTSLGQMSKNFNKKTLANQEIHDEIFKINISDATRPLSEDEKQLLNSKNYVDLFKTIAQKKVLPYYEEENEKFPLFEHCHAMVKLVIDIHQELTTFFSKPENKKHSDKYKTKIDNAMNVIKNFF